MKVKINLIWNRFFSRIEEVDVRHEKDKFDERYPFARERHEETPIFPEEICLPHLVNNKWVQAIFHPIINRHEHRYEEVKSYTLVDVKSVNGPIGMVSGRAEFIEKPPRRGHREVYGMRSDIVIAVEEFHRNMDRAWGHDRGFLNYKYGVHSFRDLTVRQMEEMGLHLPDLTREEVERLYG